MDSEKKLTCGIIKGELVYTLYGVAYVLGTSYPTARRELINKKIPYQKVGRDFRVLESDLYAYLYNEKARKGVHPLSHTSADVKPSKCGRTPLLKLVSNR